MGGIIGATAKMLVLKMAAGFNLDFVTGICRKI